jgi:hypothetical protein
MNLFRQGPGQRRHRGRPVALVLIAIAGLIGTVSLASPGQAAVRTAPAPKVRYDDLPDSGLSFVPSGGAWTARNLTYWFDADTSDLAASTQHQAVLDALGIWARQTPLRFTQAASSDAADLRIKFASGDHGDGFPFDGAGAVLAHAFFPPPVHPVPIAGDVHFDDAETWTADTRTTSADPFDLVTVAAHELGHALGLDHSTVSTALMAPFYTGSHRFLDADDVAGIRSLYNRGTGNAAWVWSNQTNPDGCYTPAPLFQFNPDGFSSTICLGVTGRYHWDIPRTLPGNGNVQVTAYGFTPRRCKVVNWTGASGGPTSVNIACFTLAGVPANAQFVARFQNAGPREPLQGAYLWSSSTGSNTPPAAFSFNSFGGTNTVTRSGVGAYTATLPGFTGFGDTVHVTAYGSDSTYCKVAGWGVPTVNVRCFTAAGAPADSLFTLVYNRQHLSTVGGPGAYGWTQDTNGAISPFYTWHSTAQTLTTTHTSTGFYTVFVPGIKGAGSTNAHVTAYGSGNESCQVGSFVASGTGTNIEVRCFRPDGTPVDTLFTVSYLADS